MRDPAELLEAWRSADGEARAVEYAVCETSLKALEGRADPPAASIREQARSLREKANELLKVALDEIDNIVTAIRKDKPGREDL